MANILDELVHTPRSLSEYDVKNSDQIKIVRAPSNYKGLFVLDKAEIMRVFNKSISQYKTDEECYYMIRGKTIYKSRYNIISFGFNEEGNFVFKRFQKKFMNKTKLMRLKREIYILFTVNHPGIIKLLNIVETAKEIVLFFPYYKNGDLLQYLNTYIDKPPSISFANKILGQILQIVYYLHSIGIIHRDIKMENLLLDDNYNLILTDFEFSTRSALYNYSSLGTYEYAAPEILLNQQYIGPEVDMYSIGILYYMLLKYTNPFSLDKNLRLHEMSLGLNYKTISHLPDSVQILLCRLLEYEPGNRYNIFQCITADVIRPYIKITQNEKIEKSKMNEIKAISSNDIIC